MHALSPVLRIGCSCADSGVQDAPTAADPQGPEGGSPWYAPMQARGHDARMQTCGRIDHMAGESVVVASQLTPIRLARTASVVAASLLSPIRPARTASVVVASLLSPIRLDRSANVATASAVSLSSSSHVVAFVSQLLSVTSPSRFCGPSPSPSPRHPPRPAHPRALMFVCRGGPHACPLTWSRGASGQRGRAPA